MSEISPKLRISLCTVQSFDPVQRTATGARADDGQPPRMAIMALAKAMEENGYPRGSWDYYDIDMLLPSDEAMEAYFRAQNPQVIGLSAIVCSFYNELKRVARIARKACPDAWIVMGGHLAGASNVALRKTDVDICVGGDGEYPWIDLLRYFERNGRAWNYEELAKIKGLAYIDGDDELVFTGFAPQIAGNELMQPDYDLLRLGLKDQPELLDKFFVQPSGFLLFDKRLKTHWSTKGAQVISSKGCVAKCTFCQRAAKGYRTATLESLEEHVKMLKEKFGVGVIHYSTEENFGSDIAKTRQLADMMVKYDMLWVAGSMRVGTFTREDLQYMADRGCLGGVYGLESGSQMMLDAIEKKITVEEIVDAFQNSVDAGFTTFQSNWLVGNPGDTRQTSIETGRTCGRLAHILGVPPWITLGGIAYVMPTPGTPLYEYAQHVGAVPTDPDGEEAYLLHLGRIYYSFKTKYTNVNGASRREWIFWDTLIRLEASRTYRDLCKKSSPGDHEVGRQVMAYHMHIRETGGVNQSFRVRLTSFDFFINNRVVDALPRWFIYPALEWANYLVNGLAKDVVAKMFGLPREVGFPIPKLPPRLELDPKAAQRKRGLRYILKEAVGDALSRTEASQRVLVRGQ